MKKLLIASLIGLLPTLLNAQQVAINDKIKSPEVLTAAPTSTNISAKELRKAEREKFHFAKTTKAFNRDFGNASDVQWSTSKSQFTASFNKNNVKTVAWYTKGGNLTYTMHTYSADKLPAREQDVIANEYEDYKITLVNEIHQNDIVVYVVHLENERNIKLITVCDGLTNIYREYRKQ